MQASRPWSPPLSRAHTAPGNARHCSAGQTVPKRSPTASRPRSDGVAAAVQLVALEVVPVALDAHLDDVARELLARRLELRQLFGRLDAAPVGTPQPVAVDVRHQHEAVGAADGTVAVEALAEVARRPQQLGLGVADVEASPLPGAQVTQHCPAGQCVVDVMAHGSERKRLRGHLARRATHDVGSVRPKGPGAVREPERKETRSVDISLRYIGAILSVNPPAMPIESGVRMLEIAVLGLLKEQPLHGYELKKRLS